jgi:hypothetical protein
VEGATYPSADPRPAFEDGNADTVPQQHVGAAQARDAGADNAYVRGAARSGACRCWAVAARGGRGGREVGGHA